MKKETDAESSTSTNDEITYDKNTSEEIPCHQNSADLIDHTCADTRNNLLNIEEELDVTFIHYINESTDIYMNEDDNFIHKYYASFLSSKNHEYVSSGSEHD